MLVVRSIVRNPEDSRRVGEVRRRSSELMTIAQEARCSPACNTFDQQQELYNAKANEV